MDRTDSQQDVYDTVCQHSFDKGYNLYAIIDAARIESMPGKLFELEDDPNFVSLFQGLPQEDIIDMAPYLIKLSPDSAVLDWLTNDIWDEAWGIFVVSEFDMDVLFEHFQGLLFVLGPDGDRLYFRYYDPTVLQVFLPTCNESEVKQLLEPVKHVIMVDKSINKIRCLKYEYGQLHDC